MSRAVLPLAFAATTALSATMVTAVAGDAPSTLPNQSFRAIALATSRPAPAAAAPTPQQIYLIRSTLLALNDANRTGNYTVLRDSAAPSFQTKYSSADLAIAFAQSRSSLDLTSAGLATPRLTAPATITPRKSLLLKGEVAGAPTAIQFQIEFEPVNGHWRLTALAVGAAPPAKVANR